ncbi:MAG: SDR family NAD(P)-dependent oxidoreductase, partial [Bdellovibrionales bacterium]|nr:SDR family NAD(P)-dependent oxidoreductase [Bdellovibrionales bacterium]
MLNLENKRVFITGASRGIGAGTAKILANLGCKVAISYTSNEESANKVLEQL